MKIAALHKSSFVDYPGKIAAVAFTPGCNLNCFYCHNRALVEGGDDLMTIPQSTVLGFLRKRQGLLDAIVITGGEPTIQSGLADFIQEIRCLGYLIKLDTNGTHPEVLASLINAGLLDYVAMDVKAPPEKYNSICGAAVDLNAVNASIDLLLAGRIDYEFRTTIAPQLTNVDILDIGWRIRGARAYVLQRYRRPEPVAPGLGLRFNKPPGSASCMPGILEKLKDMVQRCAVRGFDNSHSQKTEISIPILPQ